MIKPIHNDIDYQSTLKRVESLWGSKQDTPDGDELEILLVLIEAYENKHFSVSAGSACTSAVAEPSHVLAAMGISDEDAYASIRFSFGKYNTQEEVEEVGKAIKSTLL